MLVYEQSKSQKGKVINFVKLTKQHFINSLSFEIHKMIFVIDFYLIQCCFFLNEQPSLNLAFPPVGVHKIVEHPLHWTTV